MQDIIFDVIRVMLNHKHQQLQHDYKAKQKALFLYLENQNVRMSRAIVIIFYLSIRRCILKKVCEFDNSIAIKET